MSERTVEVTIVVDGVARRLTLAPGSHLVGASAEADVRIAHPTVSRRHALLTVGERELVVEDLGSANGTLANGARLRGPTAIDPGTALQLGAARVEVGVADAGAGTTTAVSLGGTAALARGALELAAAAEPSSSSGHLGLHTIGVMRDAGRERVWQPGEVVLRRGTRQDSVFVVISGEVELRIADDEGHSRPVARLGRGATFGAESLGGAPASVDAVAVSHARVLEYPAEALPTAYASSASLQRKLLKGIVRNLSNVASDAVELLRGTGVMARLAQGDTEDVPLVAASPRMRTLVKRVEQVAGQRGPVLIVGAPGAGKLTVARLLHRSSERCDGQMLVVNCDRLDPRQAAELILGAPEEGAEEGEGSRLGGVHLAHGGTLVLRAADALDADTQALIANHMVTQRLTRAPFPDTRLVLLARATSGDQATPVLAPVLSAQITEVLSLPTLEERPKDIVPLAEAFLERTGSAPLKLTEEARRTLLSLRYRRHNVSELREIVELAARCAEHDEIRPEHVFEGLGSEAPRQALDLTATPLLRWLTRRHGLAVARGATLLGFLGVIAACAFAAESKMAALANGAVWSAWEPAVFALFLLVGPVWCTICPLSTAGRLAHRLACLDRPPPEWLRRHGPWLAVAGFAAIVWSERAFHMTRRPLASAVLLAALVAASVLACLVYRREVWCRHLCPLGRLAVVLAPASPLQLSAQKTVCASSCTTHACYKGDDRVPGCSVFHHPLEVRQAHHCKLCLDCLRSCPHGSARLEARLPLRGVWNIDATASHLGGFAAVVSMLALGLLAVQRITGLDALLPVTSTCVAAVAVGVVLWLALPHLLGAHDATGAGAVRVALSMALLGWGALMAAQVANIPLVSEGRLLLRGGLDVALLPAVQLLAIAATLILSVLALARTRASLEREGTVISPLRWWLLRGLFVAYAAGAGVLVAGW